jgi:hypothetical protein
MDEAYGASFDRIIAPWSGAGLITRAPYKDAFNYIFSRGYRNAIEHAFGVFFARFGIFWRPLTIPVRLVPFVVFALARIHNFLIDFKETEAPAKGTGLGYFGSRDKVQKDGTVRHEQRRRAGEKDGYDDFIYRQSVVADEFRRNRKNMDDTLSIREEITRALERAKITRPVVTLGRMVV